VDSKTIFWSVLIRNANAPRSPPNCDTKHEREATRNCTAPTPSRRRPLSTAPVPHAPPSLHRTRNAPGRGPTDSALLNPGRGPARDTARQSRACAPPTPCRTPLNPLPSHPLCMAETPCCNSVRCASLPVSSCCACIAGGSRKSHDVLLQLCAAPHAARSGATKRKDAHKRARTMQEGFHWTTICMRRIRECTCPSTGTRARLGQHPTVPRHSQPQTRKNKRPKPARLTSCSPRE